MSTLTDTQTALPKVLLNAQRFDAFINGDDEAYVTIDNGFQIRSLRGLLKYANGAAAGIKTLGTKNLNSNTTLTRATYAGTNVVATAAGITLTFPNTQYVNGEALLLKNASDGPISLAFPGGSDGVAVMPAGASAIYVAVGNGSWRQYSYVLPIGTGAGMLVPTGDDGKLPAAVIPSNTGGAGTGFLASFAAIALATIPVGVDRVDTVAYAAGSKIGAATYVADAAVNSSYVSANPRSSAITANGRGFRIANFALSPEMFGATGLAGGDDHLPVQALAKEVQRRNGGVIDCAYGATYIVGSQAEQQNGVVEGQSPVKLMGLTRGVTVNGNGSCFRTKPGLKYGSFNPANGQARPGISTDYGDSATPFHGFFNIQDCSGGVLIQNLELDGNINNLTIGGQFGDTGRQMPHCGLYVLRNSGDLTFVNLRAHHCGLDGVLTQQQLTKKGASNGSVVAINVRTEYNGRQGWSWVAGRGGLFLNCKFNHTGKNGVVASNPGAGFDVEAEGGQYIAQLKFDRCEFTNNVGAGIVSDVGISEDVTLDNCVLVGTTASAVFTRDPRWRFRECTIAGVVSRCYPGSNDTLDGQRATKFVDCLFTDDPQYAPVGMSIYMPGFCVDLGIGVTYTLFDNCDFVLTTTDGRLPYTLGGERYNGCRMSQTGSQPGVPSGQYTWQNKIQAPNINTAGVTVLEGRTTVNGTVYMPGGSGGSAGLDGAWVSYTPVVTANQGSFGSVIPSGRYKQVGKTVFFRTEVYISDAGNANVAVKATLPVAAAYATAFGGRESLQVGFGLAVFVDGNSNSLLITKYDGTFAGGTNYRLLISGVYEAV